MIAIPHRLRLLVAIASYGTKNLGHLRRIIRDYQAMAMEVDIVVFSNEPKDLGAGVAVRVGLPAHNPWSLPFAHKRVFAEHWDSYDLFVYSEDDIAVTEANLLAFLRLAPFLAEDEIAGFLRYEVDPEGVRSLPEMHGSFHWRLDSVRRRGPHTVAEFTNEHAALYVLTREHLRKAIASGGFIRPPAEGEYDMLCTAATDPYTRCGFRKVICISAIEDFLIHHLPNRYAGLLGLGYPALLGQIETLLQIGARRHPASMLGISMPGLLRRQWAKAYDGLGETGLLGLAPIGAKTILSVGCGLGAAEEQLHREGAAITVLPLDSVVGAAAERRGMEVIYGTMAEGLARLEGRSFDCVLVANLLHLVEEPGRMADACARRVGRGGVLVLTGPNFDFFKVLVRRTLGWGDYGKLRRFREGAITVCGPRSLTPQVRRAGLKVEAPSWLDLAGTGRIPGATARWAARHWALRAWRPLQEATP